MSSVPAVRSSDPVLRLKNFAASAAVVVLACLAYRAMPHGAAAVAYLHGNVGFSFSGGQFLLVAALAYIALLAGYYAFEAEPAVSKSLRFVRVAAVALRDPLGLWRRGLSRDDRQAVLVTLLKGYFAPLMLMSLMAFTMGTIRNGSEIVANAGASDLRRLFDSYGFWFALKAILLIDVLCFTVGYLVESPRLGNQIRSVDPTLLGWAAAMACYPPFNSVTSALLGSSVQDFPVFDDTATHFGLNLLLLALMAVYAWASVALGLKASNLTHRGIIARGPYAIVRHPAYVCKNMAWWIGSLPFITLQFGASWLDGTLAVASVIGWSAIYVLRALTEEDHLRSVDGEYAAYAARVRWRFIPGIV